MEKQQKALLVGIDVGSTTVKIAVLDPDNLQVLHSRYERHNAEQAVAVRNLLTEAHELFPENDFIPTFCGSAGQPYAEVTRGFFLQEVVANTLAIKAFYPETRTAVELGGQDAKVIFFEKDETRDQLTASDMRMNGSCAGGTGAFIDQIAELLHIKTEDFNAYAQRGKTVYEISGRCGVFAKTDISPLINQGVSREDIALSAFHALVKQTIGGLAQGMTFRSKVIFEGGPLTFNTVLVDVFTERIGLTPDEVIIPERPEIIVACGAALSPRSFHADKPNRYSRLEALKALEEFSNKTPDQMEFARPFFADKNEREAFHKRHPKLEEDLPEPHEGKCYPVWIGIDAGSTTAKFVMIDDDGKLLDKFYAPNQGEPLEVVTQGLKDLRDRWIDAGAILNIKGVGTTGYGENLFAKAYHADYHCVETVAHARAARQFAPDVSFILDIGGQDMKAISLSEGIVSGIILNEACSAGCGSFLETYARSLGIPVEEAGETAFTAKNPSHLGSRCTVFMNSAIVTEQKNGSSSGDIIAGICRSIIENVFTKVIRISNFSHLGDKVVVQGGTFKNDAVLRALEQYIERPVIRAPHPGEMGALGVALLCKENSDESASTFIGFTALDTFNYEKNPGQTCPFCANHCSRTVVSFNDGSSYITGNRCERGEVLGNINDAGVREKLKESNKARDKVPDLLALPAKLLFADFKVEPVCEKKNLKIGIPKTLEFWSSAPFWSTLFQALGYETVFSDSSSYRIFDKALPYIPSDTVCFPAKLAHGHVESLVEKGVDRIFFPQMIQSPQENKSAERSFYCVILQGYPLVVEKSNETEERMGIPMDTPLFHWTNEALKKKQIIEFLEKVYGVKPLYARKAYALAGTVLSDCETRIAKEGKRALESLEDGQFAVLVACRPYHL
ncbi:MAG: CoA activase, partial [Spirochaetaceae bacterium]|nr:CoA activase [Spirochaetaceae bacterium]